MIHVCFGLHDKTGRYSKFTGTAMLSIFENLSAPPQSTTVHILHDNTLTQSNREKFIYVAGQYSQVVKFHNVEKICADRLAEMINLVPAVKTARVSVGAFYRLLAPQILSLEIEKIIYLDSDIVVNLDVRELWQIELGKKILAAVPEAFNRNDVQTAFPLVSDGLVKKDDYFNSGVLLMNLNLLRDEDANIMKGVKFRGDNPRQFFLDQTVWNYCFSLRTLKLPPKFNRFTIYARKDHELNLEKKIYHFAGAGFSLDMTDPFNRLWMNYFIRTPWFDVDAIARLYAGVQQLHVGLKQAMVQVSAAMSGKDRAFFAMPNDVPMLKKIFFIRDDEEIILAENQSSIKNLLDAMNFSRGRKIFFILLKDFPFGLLIQAGFVPGKDFVNGTEFFSEINGAPLNSYPLIQVL